ncbi:M24 family metallopeptidase [Brevibacillus ginsengisoli]|uniref:M24 family metallopeptidase n=1 Tax=Brevibacillus ginsengisoli TaxID=363854 RepID=UPI003CF96D9D
MKQRIENLRKQLAELGADAIMTENQPNRRYISGFTGSSGWAIVSKNQAVLLTDFRYIDQATEQAPEFEIINTNRAQLPAIAQALKDLGVKKLAFEKHLITYNTYEEWAKNFEGVELVATSGVIEQLREIKDESELQLIKEATRIADATFEHILSYIKPGVSELDVATEMEFHMRKLGASSSSFDIIVASGKRGALPHGVASEKVIQAGEMVTLDFGALYKGYVSDITRTVAVGEPDPKMKEIYDIVLRAQLNGVEKLKPGMTGKEADDLTRDIIRDAGYAEAYGHSTGHSIGLLVHEAPNLSSASTAILKPGNVVTVEPGIYISDLGGVRIEDDVLITETGCEILTKSTKELLILPV